MSDNQENVSGSMSPALTGDVPQFAVAEYSQTPGVEHCRICGNAISGNYYRVNTQIACADCAGQIRRGQPVNSHAAFVQGTLYGIGAAVAGLVAYAAFTIVTHLYVGYIAVGVGWLVGWAMRKGSNGLGGWRYQAVAVALTYAAISLAAIPIELSSVPGLRLSMLMTPDALKLVWIGLASPFLELRDPMDGVIGLFILFIGLQIAYRMTAAKRLLVEGPYKTQA